LVIPHIAADSLWGDPPSFASQPGVAFRPAFARSASHHFFRATPWSGCREITAPAG
jgi:hypothetical protein